MTKDELMRYYEYNKNIRHEIKLKGHNTGDVYIFRHYLEFGSGDDKWLNTLTGTLLNTTHLLKYYEIPHITFNISSDVNKYINQNSNNDNIVIFDNNFNEPIEFIVHKYIRDDIKVLISKRTGKAYSFDDIIACKYKPHREDVMTKQYEYEGKDKLLKTLKVGDIIELVYWDDIKVHFKKIDDDCFIGCDKAGHVFIDPSDKLFVYKSKQFKSAITKDIKKVIE